MKDMDLQEIKRAYDYEIAVGEEIEERISLHGRLRFKETESQDARRFHEVQYQKAKYQQQLSQKRCMMLDQMRNDRVVLGMVNEKLTIAMYHLNPLTITKNTAS